MEQSDLVYLSATEALTPFRERELSPVDLLEAHDAFICPTVAVPDIPADLASWEDFEVDGTPVPADGSWVMTMLFNMFSRCPVLAVPSGFTASGMPSGIQIVGRPFDDLSVFRVGAALGRTRSWLDWRRRHPALD